MAEQHASSEERLANDERARAHRPRWTRGALVIACVVCTLIVAARIPALVESAEALPPIRTGRYTTAGHCDDCVNNLWAFGAAMQADTTAPSSLSCPATSAPYRTEKSSGAASTLVSCPNPAEHGLASLSVSGSSPIPEAR
ncbi:MAG: hypothetical protein Q7W16_02760 [Coriobacteriia bacterium]|nr:hypothetical protein [Coriobacteriia bacterium]